MGGCHVRGGEWGGRLGPSYFRDTAGLSFKHFALSFFIILLKSWWTTLESRLAISEASHAYFSNKATVMCKCISQWSKSYRQMCQRAPQQLHCVDKNHSKSDEFRQITMRNILPRGSKFPDKMKNLTCFPRIKFLYSMCEEKGPLPQSFPWLSKF